MAEQLRPPPEQSPEVLAEQQLGRARLAASIALFVLAAGVVTALLRQPGDGLVLVQVVALAAFAAALGVQVIIGRRLARRRDAREQGFTRMLQGLSRSLSAEAIVQAIVDELRRAADADHVIVARVRPAERVVETTLVSSSAQVPTSRTILPLSVLDPAAASSGRRSGSARGRSPEQMVADELAARLRRAYGLPRTLASPLVADERIVGALMLSRRQERPWTAADRRLLSWSAHELSAALARAYAFEEAESRANIDALTGLPNRRYLEELIAVVEPRRRAGDSVGALMIDIDHFKRLNDRYGHATGDQVLRAVGEQIQAAVRTEDTPARYGGEEFAVVLRRANAEQALEVAERVRQAIAGIPPRELGTRDPISVSVGVAVSGAQDGDVGALLQSADAALYRAKRYGRNRVVLA
ncbi:MAG TPA: sensor domain-containing diguanylate cyclase [Candidatus Limnocylindria bacterium]|nr:sensor domain-containing diguanylate cyclase [Candidatus Limnocylindria bacterium]